MNVIIRNSDLRLLEIEKQYQANFRPYSETYTDYMFKSLEWIGRALMPANATNFVFCDNVYWYDCDETRYGLYITENLSVILRDYDRGKMWRIEF